MKKARLTAGMTQQLWSGDLDPERGVGKVKNNTISTQIRLPARIHEFIRQEAARMGIAQNAFLVILLEQGKKLWQAEVSLRREEK